MSDERLLTRRDVNALVPRLEALMARLQRCALELQRERDALSPSDDHPSVERLTRERPRARGLIEEIDGVVTEVDALGGRLKDLELGLIDFPAEHRGEEVLLCWQFGEPEVAFWHREDEGFGGRKALPGRSERPALQ